MSARDLWTAIPRDVYGKQAAPPADPLPWSDEMNDLYIHVAQEAWDDLIRPDGPPRRGFPSLSLGRDALTWIEEGGRVRLPDRPDGLSLWEVWGWPPEAVTRAAHARYADRAALWASRVSGLNARGGRPLTVRPARVPSGTVLATSLPQNGSHAAHVRRARGVSYRRPRPLEGRT